MKQKSFGLFEKFASQLKKTITFRTTAGQGLEKVKRQKAKGSR
jgi:hypothetical protein